MLFMKILNLKLVLGGIMYVKFLIFKILILKRMYLKQKLELSFYKELLYLHFKLIFFNQKVIKTKKTIKTNYFFFQAKPIL